MLYTLEQGKIEPEIIRQCMRENHPLPEKIKNAPELALGLELYYGAFFDLHTCRPLGLSEGSIKWVDINDYCNRLELTDEQTDDMHYYIRAMDNEYLAWNAKKVEKSKGK